MKKSIKVSLMILALGTGISCKDNKAQDSNSIIIGSRALKDELPGSVYRIRTKSYFVVQGQDTSRFSCAFSETKADSSIHVHIAFQRDLSYDQQLREMKLLFSSAAKDFDMKRLKGLSIGRLVTSGDLAVRITQQYRERFGNNTRIGSYAKVALFLQQSPLGVDLNTLLLPYGHVIDHISVEKVFFTDKQVLYSYSKLTTDSTTIPLQILDCMTWISVAPKP